MLLVTGITGHSGGYFLQELIDHAYGGRIRCVVRQKSDTAALLKSGLEADLAVGDPSDQVFLDRVMDDVETVVHIASIRHSAGVVAAAVRSQVSRVILVHTTGIYSKFKSASAEYRAIEQAIDGMRMPSTGIVILRPTMIYGYLGDRNMSVFIKMVDRLRLFPVVDGGQSPVQPVHGSDLGRAYYQLLIHPEVTEGEYTLSGERPVSMRELFSMISSALGKRTTFISVPLAGGVFLARVLKILSLGQLDYIERMQRMGEDRAFPHDDASRDFGYRPKPLEEGIRLEVEEYLRSCA
ncbi:MAG: SDR family oxidoreductase [Coriobacteriia bacterium]